MCTTHGIACCHDAIGIHTTICFCIDIKHTWSKFICDVAYISFLLFNTSSVIPAFGRPGSQVITVTAEHLDTSAFDKIFSGINHAHVFIVKKTAILAWEDKKWSARVTIDFEFHVTSQIVGIFLIVLYLHSFTSLTFSYTSCMNFMPSSLSAKRAT